MNNEENSYKSLLLMSELEEGDPISQREISSRLGIALGLVNSYLKNLVQKGYVTIKAYPRNRYAYLLTPKGFAEKSRLAFEHLSNFTRLYKVARKEYVQIFETIADAGYDRVAFCGVDETAEIAYLSLQEVGMDLEIVMDADAGDMFFGKQTLSLQEGIAALDNIPIVLTSYYKTTRLRKVLLAHGVAEEYIYQLEGGE
jgi:predicted transcriptional regulator